MDIRIEKFISLAVSIIKRPSMYHVNKVEDIYFIFLGYRFCEENHSEKGLNEFLLGFRNYINKKFDNPIESDWYRIIRFYSGSDKHSLELFADSFLSYLESNSLKS